MPLRTWPARGLIAGAAGTAVMSLAYGAERRLRRHHSGQLDYDDSLVPGTIVAAIIRLPHPTDRQAHALGLALRWAYGSAFGVLYGAMRRAMGDPWALGAFGGTVLTGTFTLFPLLGRTPPPWRWPRHVLATSVFTHATYVVAVAVVDAAAVTAPARRRARAGGGRARAAR